MKKRLINHNIAVPADHQATIISQPGKSSLHCPSTLVASQLAAIVIFPLLIVTPVGANQVDPPGLSNASDQSRWPRSSNTARKVRHISSQTPTILFGGIAGRLCHKSEFCCFEGGVKRLCLTPVPYKLVLRSASELSGRVRLSQKVIILSRVGWGLVPHHSNGRDKPSRYAELR
jgi:hypothetical protein